MKKQNISIMLEISFVSLARQFRFLHPWPKETPVGFLSIYIVFVCSRVLYKQKSQHVILCVWLLSFMVMFLRDIYAVTGILFLADHYSVYWAYDILFIHYLLMGICVKHLSGYRLSFVSWVNTWKWNHWAIW